MPRDEYEFDIELDQQMFTYWTSMYDTALQDIYQSIKAEDLLVKLIRTEVYKKRNNGRRSKKIYLRTNKCRRFR